MASSNIFKGRWTLWIIALVCALVAGFGTLTLVGQAAQRVNYYVVTQDVAARTQITAENTTAVSVPADSVPQTALTEEEVASGEYYSTVALQAQSVLISSVVSKGLNALSSELPKGYVMASLLVKPEDAAGGRIKRGDYVDIAATNAIDGSSLSKIVLHHVLVLDVTVQPDSVASAANAGGSGADGMVSPGPDSPALYGGIPQMYTFAVTPEEFAKMALIRDSAVYLALTSASATDAIDVQSDFSTLFTGGPVGASTGGAASAGGSTTVAPAADLKASVESFYQTQTLAGNDLKVVGTDLVSYSAADGTEVDSISLGSGTIDLKTGIYTAAK